MPATFPPPADELIVNKVFDASVSGTVPAGTMVSLTKTGTVIDKAAPMGNVASLVTLSASTTTSIYPCDMGGQTFVVGYLDTTNGSATTLIACSVSGSTITAGAPVVVSTSTNGSFHICKLSSTLGVIVYNDTTNASTHTAMAFSLSGTTITLGAAQTTSTSVNTTAGFLLSASSATTFLFGFSDSTNSNRLSLVAGSVSGTTISVGAKVQLSTSTNLLSVTQIGVLSATAFVVVYTDNQQASRFSTVAGTLSGNTITLGSIVFGSDVGNANKIPYLGVFDSTHFFFVSQAASNNSLTFGLVSGTTITLGSPVSLSSSLGTLSIRDIPNGILKVIDSTHAYTGIGYVTQTSDTTGTMSLFDSSNQIIPAIFLSSSLALTQNSVSASQSLALSGSTGTASELVVLNASSFSGLSIITHSTTRAIAVGHVTAGLVAQIIEAYSPGNPSRLGRLGITLSPGQAGQSVPIVLADAVSGFSGLAQGNRVFVAGDGSLNSTGLGIAIGFALDSSTILMRRLASTTSPVVLTP